jgi:hypothetical protein
MEQALDQANGNPSGIGGNGNQSQPRFCEIYHKGTQGSDLCTFG